MEVASQTAYTCQITLKYYLDKIYCLLFLTIEPTTPITNKAMNTSKAVAV